jgi:hypothetical protein
MTAATLTENRHTWSFLALLLALACAGALLLSTRAFSAPPQPYLLPDGATVARGTVNAEVVGSNPTQAVSK